MQEAGDPGATKPVDRPHSCAVHPGVPASITCPRCGSYACSECTADSLWGDEVCAACAQKGALEYPLAWDKGDDPLPSRFWRATMSVLFDARQVFPHLPKGSVARALGYAVLVEALVGIAELLMFLIALSSRRGLMPSAMAMVLSDPVVVPLRGLASAALIGLTFHGIAVLFGGKTSLGTSMRAALYLRAFDLAWIPMQIAVFLPLAGGVLQLMLTLAQVAFQGWALAMLARGRHGLGHGAALVAGAAPLAIAIAVYAAIQLGTLVLASSAGAGG